MPPHLHEVAPAASALVLRLRRACFAFRHRVAILHNVDMRVLRRWVARNADAQGSGAVHFMSEVKHLPRDSLETI